MSENKYLGASGIKYLWRKILTREQALFERIMAVCNSKLDSIGAADDSITVTNNSDVNVNISQDLTNKLELKTTGDIGLYVAPPEPKDTYSIVKDNSSDSFAAVYRLQKFVNGTGQGIDVGVDINIPKDLALSAGAFVVKETQGVWGEPGNYIELTVNNGGNIYIPLGPTVTKQIDSSIDISNPGDNLPTSQAVYDCVMSNSQVLAGLGLNATQGLNELNINLATDSRLSNAAKSQTEVANRVYPVVLDKNDNLAVNVPWTDTNVVRSVAGKVGIITLSKSDVGLGNVDNTKDTDKPLSTAMRNALANKIDTNNRDQAAFYGLAEAAGDTSQELSDNNVGDYTEEAKQAIRRMLGIPNTESEIIADVTVSEDSKAVDILTDLYSMPFELRVAKIICTIPASTTGNVDFITAKGRVVRKEDDIEAWTYLPTKKMTSANGTIIVYEIECFNGLWFNRAYTASSFNMTSGTYESYMNNALIRSISGFELSQYAEHATLIPAGTRIQIIGVRF